MGREEGWVRASLRGVCYGSDSQKNKVPQKHRQIIVLCAEKGDMNIHHPKEKPGPVTWIFILF